MTEREKVTKGLERYIEKLDTVVNKTHGFNCTACPYFRKCDSSGYLIGLPLMRDTLALLKVQEPRVMTPEEVFVWAEMPAEKRDPIFFEQRKGPNGWIANSACPKDYYLYCEDGDARCWTSRPTDTQKGATPWN